MLTPKMLWDVTPDATLDSHTLFTRLKIQSEQVAALAATLPAELETASAIRAAAQHIADLAETAYRLISDQRCRIGDVESSLETLIELLGPNDYEGRVNRAGLAHLLGNVLADLSVQNQAIGNAV
ncbi:hypothetical protein LH425_08375 [Laribacter hongkongensis]|uniref:hypothetical protein n=1 Tax=Laribacter hongkongensis TaxID=168471 RepID=UPI001EFCB3DC|nr:hypothetical protein [Laribacter hongkongensis]MCG9065057.1 hypothetical protein [Laribacter hongkongensis]